MSSDPPTRYCRCGTRLARDNPDALCASCRRKAHETATLPPSVPPEFWQTDQVQDALTSWHIGRIIAAYRRHPYHGSRPLPQELVAGWLGMTQGQLSRVEKGPPIQDLGRLIHWARILRIPAHCLWFDLPESRRRAAPKPARAQPPASPAPLASSPSVPVVLIPVHNGIADSAGIDVAALQAFRAADRQVGGGHLYATVVHYLQTEIGPRLFGSAGGAIGRGVFCAAAGLTDMAGWMAHDTGRDGLAEQHFGRALELAAVGGDRQLEAQVRASMSHLAHHLDRPAEAIRFARAGQARLRRGPRNPSLEARLVTMEARGLAALRESGACARVLVRAEQSLDGTPSMTPSVWISRFDEASLASEAARCMRQLGQMREARRHAERVIALRTGDQTRSRAFGQLILAAVLLEQGSVDEACALGYEIVDGTEALGSFLVTQQLQELRQRLEPYRSAKVVADFLAYLAPALKARMWLGLRFNADGHGHKPRQTSDERRPESEW